MYHQSCYMGLQGVVMGPVLVTHSALLHLHCVRISPPILQPWYISAGVQSGGSHSHSLLAMIISRLQCCLLYLLCLLFRSCQSFKNDATEVLYHVDKHTADSANSSAINQARNGGRHPANSALDRTGHHQVGCRELRSTKYISDGQCTSLRPLKELVCAGECLPLPILPNWIGGGYGLKYWSRRSTQEWRCVNDKTRTQRIQLQCADGTSRTYKVTVVTSCKCKRYTRQHNESSHNYEGVSPIKPAHAHPHHHTHNNRDKKRLSKISKFISS